MYYNHGSHAVQIENCRNAMLSQLPAMEAILQKQEREAYQCKGERGSKLKSLRRRCRSTDDQLQEGVIQP